MDDSTPDKQVTESKVGRPSLYKPEYTEQLISYFDVEPYRERMKKVVTKSGDVIEVPFDEANDFPTLAGFAIQIGVHRDTLQEWAKHHPEFSAAYKRAKDFQERFIAVNGNKGLINPAFGIFTAKNVLGWKDKQPGEEDHTVNLKGAIEVGVKRIDIAERVKQLKGES